MIFDFRNKPEIEELISVYEREDGFIKHYGIKRRSGRYPYGSGKDPYQHSGDFLSRVEELRKSNFRYTDESGKKYSGDTAIAKSMGLSTTSFRTQLSLAKEERRALLVDTAKGLRAKGYSLMEIANEMGFKNDSSVRTLLNEKSEARMNQAKITADILKEQIDKKRMVDVGSGVERELGVTKEKLNESLEILKMQGYHVYGGRVEQVTNKGKWTTLKVACGPDYKNSDIYDFENIHSVRDYISKDNGLTFEPKWVYPASMDSKRLMINYAEDGGRDKDGVIELRRGVPDLDLGGSHYSQVRILVDGTHYLKGMAVYSDDLPDGIDVRFNTNKTKGTPVTKVLKGIKDDPENPFGSLIKEGISDPKKDDSFKGGQSYYYDKNGDKKLSLINKRSDEGDWNDWSNKVPSQFLAKQSESLIKRQLNLTKIDKRDEYDEILSLTNPTVKKSLLKSFADDCDSAAVHLKAASLPGQEYKVILPLTKIKDNEVYAPHLSNGEQVALIRFPHGGTFEIPILKVNNKIKEGEKVIGNTPLDAVGINSKVAERLSGADFDGDTVMVIPLKHTKVISTPKLKQLENFDTTLDYGPDSTDPVKVTYDKKGKVDKEYYTRNGKTYMRMRNTQNEMGKISNLITDMTIKGAPTDELAKAVKHSMVVIDAEKHKLDYNQSYKDNDIAYLKRKYQGRYENGKYTESAATLISRAKNEKQIEKRKGSPKINIKGTPDYDPTKPEGAYIYKNSGEYYIDAKGNKQVRTQKSTQMAETDDAYKLSSGSKKEAIYADYANYMKNMANEARKELYYAGKIKYDKRARDIYSEEVKSLKAKLDISERNAPRERLAQTMASGMMKAYEQEYDMTKAEKKKKSQQVLTQCRTQVGARRTPIDITDKEWEAIQSGAISEKLLNDILKHADMDRVRELATPKAKVALSEAKINHIAALKANGYTTAEIARKLNVSTSTVSKYLKEGVK